MRVGRRANGHILKREPSTNPPQRLVRKLKPKCSCEFSSGPNSIRKAAGRTLENTQGAQLTPSPLNRGHHTVQRELQRGLAISYRDMQGGCVPCTAHTCMDVSLTPFDKQHAKRPSVQIRVAGAGVNPKGSARTHECLKP